MCDRIDISLLARYPGDPFGRLLERHAKNAVGLALANLSAKRERPASTFAEFEKAIRRMHGIIFGLGEPEIAGRYRRQDEDVVFGRERCEFRGAPPSEVSERVRRSWEALGLRSWPALSKKQLSDACAIFLESFFMAHPFVDGNGRVGRMVVEIVVRASGRWVFLPPDRRLNTRAYIRVLEYAHKHNPINGHDDQKVAKTQHYHELLSQWLLKSFRETDGEEQDERQPDDDG